MPQNDSAFKAIVFDLGGVLIELTGVSQMLGWMSAGTSESELWRRWLASPGVRQFESGRSTAADFATAIVNEFGLAVPAEQFLHEFTYWPRALYPGVTELLQSLAPQFTLATLSNTNALHWTRISNEMGLLHLFNFHFPSHQLGMLKPDTQVFEHVADSLGCRRECILFLDDNALNVAAATTVGMRAYRVLGATETMTKLKELQLLDSDQGK